MYTWISMALSNSARAFTQLQKNANLLQSYSVSGEQSTLFFSSPIYPRFLTCLSIPSHSVCMYALLIPIAHRTEMLNRRCFVNWCRWCCCRRKHDWAWYSWHNRLRPEVHRHIIAFHWESCCGPIAMSGHVGWRAIKPSCVSAPEQATADYIEWSHS